MNKKESEYIMKLNLTKLNNLLGYYYIINDYNLKEENIIKKLTVHSYNIFIINKYVDYVIDNKTNKVKFKNFTMPTNEYVILLVINDKAIQLDYITNITNIEQSLNDISKERYEAFINILNDNTIKPFNEKIFFEKYKALKEKRNNDKIKISKVYFERQAIEEQNNLFELFKKILLFNEHDTRIKGSDLIELINHYNIDVPIKTKGSLKNLLMIKYDNNKFEYAFLDHNKKLTNNMISYLNLVKEVNQKDYNVLNTSNFVNVYNIIATNKNTNKVFILRKNIGINELKSDNIKQLLKDQFEFEKDYITKVVKKNYNVVQYN